jgi:uncharacterized hydrophobic protein (TIGR00271 family)
MSFLLIIGSEEALTRGLEWCEPLCLQRALTLHIVVPGSDRKALAELARLRVSEHLPEHRENVHIELVDDSAPAVLGYARKTGCKSMLIIFREDDAKLQRHFFEESRIASMWLRASGPPPNSPREVRAVFRSLGRMGSTACNSLLGFLPGAVLGKTADLEADDLPALARDSIESDLADESGMLLVVDVEHVAPQDRVYQAGLSLLEQPPTQSIALLHPGDTFLEAMGAKIRHWAERVAPPMDRDQRIELAQDLQLGSQPNLEFLGLMSAASMLASFGLLQNSASVIIGAMLIAPLMTPILGAGLALTQGNRPLFQSALGTILLGFLGALFASVLFGWLYLTFHDPIVTSEMWSRSRPSPLDVCVGLVGGLAASYARTRHHLSSALAGAAIAAALVPPIATAGLQLAFRQWGASERGSPVVGPLLLVAVNVLTIMVGSSFILWARGMRVDRSPSAKDRWVLRMLAMLMLLVLLILVWTFHPFADD